MNSTDQYVEVLLKYLRGKGYRNFGAVLGDNAFAEALFHSFQAQLNETEQVTVIDRYVAGQYEMRSTLTKIRSASYDAVGIFLSLSQIAQFYKQRHEQRLNFPTFGTNFFESLSEIRASGHTMSGAVYASNSVRHAFAERFALLERLSKVGPQPRVATGPYAFRDLPDTGKFFEFDLTMKVIQGESTCEFDRGNCPKSWRHPSRSASLRKVSETFRNGIGKKCLGKRATPGSLVRTRYMQIEPAGILASNGAAVAQSQSVKSPTGTGEWWTALQSALELKGVAPPRGNMPAPITELMLYQRRIGEWQLRVELITKAADALTSSVKRLQQGTQ